MPIPHLAAGRSVKLRMQNCGLLPERALKFQCGDLRVEVGKGTRSKLGDKRLDRVTPDRALIRQ